MPKLRGILGALLDPRLEGPLPVWQQIRERFVLWDDEYGLQQGCMLGMVDRKAVAVPGLLAFRNVCVLCRCMWENVYVDVMRARPHGNTMCVTTSTWIGVPEGMYVEQTVVQT